MTLMKISYQGEPGSNSEMVVHQLYPQAEGVPCRTFEGTLTRVESGAADLAIIPIENSLAGRVGDIHHLLPQTKLQIIGEHYQPVRFYLMGLESAQLADIKRARTHIMGIGQCRNFLHKHQIDTEVSADTAGAAREVSEAGDPSVAAIAPRLAASVYGLKILAEEIQDTADNTTRFLIMAREGQDVLREDGPVKTAFVFQTRNIPAALFKVLGGFATNSINMTKLESYQLGSKFAATQFYAEIEGHPEDPNVSRAMEELGFFSQAFHLLGVFPKAVEKRSQ